MVIDLTISANSFSSDGQTIGGSHFGIIQTGFGEFSGFQNQFSELNGQSIRWPGGTLSEVQENVYGLDVPGIFDGTKLWTENDARVRPDLADMFDFAVTNDLPFSMLIPTARYADSLPLAKKHFSQFLDDLATGKYGPIPQDFTLELGNEYYAQTEFSNDPAKYGTVANELLSVLDGFRDDPKYGTLFDNLKVSVQMGKSTPDDVAIRGAISSNNLENIDTIVAHHLPYRFEAIDKANGQDQSLNDAGTTRAERTSEFFDDWKAAIVQAGGEADRLGLFLSAWTVGGASNTLPPTLEFQDYGARQGSTILDLFSTNVAIGTSEAAVWGVDVSNPNSLSQMVDGKVVKSSGGLAFQLMSESLGGTRLLSGFEENLRSDEIMTWSFRDGSDGVVFVAANDIPDAGLTVNLTIDGFGDIGFATAKLITYDLALDYLGDPLDPSSRLHENSYIQDTDVGISGSSLSFGFQKDFEIIRVEFTHANNRDYLEDFFDHSTSARTTGFAIDDKIYTFVGDNVVEGGAGNDQLFGGVGRDYLSGGPGDDVLVGDVSSNMFGNDVLYGGAGDDILIGGGGSDSFVFRPSEGNDTIGDPTQKVSAGYDPAVPEFSVELDELVIEGFGYESTEEILARTTVSQEGLLFADQGTSVLMLGLDADSLNEIDIIFF